MKTKLVILAAAAAFLIPLGALALNTPALNGINTPAQWIPNSASSTITPNPNTLQVPCANIVGGCSGGGGNSSSSIGLGVEFPTPQQLAVGATCGNFTGVTDAGTCINDIASSTAASTAIIVPAALATTTYNYTTPINWNLSNGKLLQLQCGVGGGFYDSSGVVFHYTPSSGSAFSVNTNGYVAGGSGITNCSFVGPAGTGGLGSSVVTSTYGINLGGTGSEGEAGAFGFTMTGVHISGFGTGLNIGSNVSFMIFDKGVINKNGQDVYSPAISGANGENMRITNSVIADCNSASGQSISAFCLDVQLSGNVQWSLTNDSFDDAQIYSNQFGGTANIWNITDIHDEDPNTGQACYDRILTQPSFVGAAATVFNIKGGDFMEDKTSGACGEFVAYGGSLILDGVTGDINNNVSSPMVDFATPLNSQATISWSGLSNQGYNTGNSANTGFTNVYGSQAYSSDGLAYGSSTASWSASTSTFSIGSTLNLQSLTAGKFLALDGNGNVVTTSTPIGGVSTGTVATLGSPLTIGGNASATIYGSATSSYIANFNSQYQFPSPAMLASNGCMGSSTITDAGACMNYIYSIAPSSTNVMVGPGLYYYQIPIVINTQYKEMNIIGSGGGGFYKPGITTFVYTSSTGIGYTYNVQQFSSGGIGLYNLRLVGPAGLYAGGTTGVGSSTSPSNTTSTVGVLIGGTNGGTGFNLYGVSMGGWAKAVQLSDNTFVTNIDNSAIEYNGMDVYDPNATNADENNRITDSVLSTASGTNCIYLANDISADWTISGDSLDNCQINMAESGTGNTLLKVTNNHFESPNESATGCYDFITSNAGQSGFLTIDSSGNDYLQNGAGTGSSCNEYISNGGNFVSSGDILGMYSAAGSSTIRFVTNLDSNDTVSWFGLTSPTTGVTRTYVYGNNPISYQGLGFGSSVPVFNVTSSYSSFNSLAIGTSSFMPTDALDAVGAIAAWDNSGTHNAVLINAGNSTGTASSNVNRIRFGGGETGGSATYFTFQQAANLDVMTLNNTKVGIGTTVPSSTLQVVDSTNSSSTLRIGVSGTNEGCLELYTSGGTLTYTYAASATSVITTSTKPAFCQ